MDPNYTMAKFGLESKGSLMSKHRGCWYYTKYFFFFLSIIQFLIILGLVLFLLYGNAHVGTELRLKSLEKRYSDLEADYSLVTKNFDQLKPKAASLENANANCSNLLNTAHRELYNKNRSVPFVFLIILGLVLFLLYGNAHVGTELRLKSLEKRYSDLEADYSLVTKNFDQLKPKAASLENANANCSNLLNTAHRELYNKNRSVPFVRPFSTSCESIQNAIDQCNTTYIIETLQLKHKKLILQRDYDRLKEKCEQTSGFLTSKVDVTVSEVEKLQEGKNDLETKIKTLQSVCTDINERFQTELERMKSRFEGIISAPEHSQYSKCLSISNEIDRSINMLQFDVRKVMSENSQLKTNNALVTDNFQKCSQENIIIISEKNHLSIEKGGLEKQLLGKNEELSKYFSMSMRKEEELQNCRRTQPAGRTPVVFSPRT